MFVNYRYFNFYLFISLITILSSTALFCSNLTSIDDEDTPCFLEKSTRNPILLRTSGNSLILPCRVARSKRSTVQWWYTDSQKSINIQIYPVFPPVRPTVLRFITGLTSDSNDINETDILDASILLRYVNVDDSGIYRCIIRPWTMDPLEQVGNILSNDDSNIGSLNYELQLTGPRLCQLNPGILPCFAAMRTSSPTIVDAYQIAFLQCVVKNHNRPISVFWVIGDSAINNVLITDYLTTNKYEGDQLRRVFPLSPFDYSLELSVNRTVPERTYSCVIEGANDIETTIFTYIIRTIDLEEIGEKTLNVTQSEKKVAAHDTLNHEQIHSLRENQKVSAEEDKTSEEHKNSEEHQNETEKHEQIEEQEQEQIEETSTTI